MGLSVFVAFASEDRLYLDELVARARREKLPFHFVHVPTCDEAEERWTSKCRIQIRGSGGVLGLVSNHSAIDPWQLWMIQCATAEKKPLLLMQTRQDDASSPNTLANRRVVAFNWTNARTWLDSLWHEATRSR